MKRHNLRTKLVRVFLLQILLISLLVIGGVYSARFIVKGVLIRHALEGEAAFFWKSYAADAGHPLPDTLNLTGFLSRKNQKHVGVPPALKSVPLGMHRVDFNGQHPIVYVSDQNGKRLYLVFDEKSVTRLAFLFGLLPLAFVLVVLYLLAWIAYRQSSKAISPVVKLASQVNAMAVSSASLQPLDMERFDTSHNPAEVHSLVNAINELIQRLHAFVERERAFSRDASHELRTPIAALKGSLEVLERRHPLLFDPAIDRMHRNIKNMQAVTETLLLLARGENQELPCSQVDVRALVAAEMDTIKWDERQKPIAMSIQETSALRVEAPVNVVEILIRNLLKNAYNYTESGSIVVLLHGNCMEVVDSGVGMQKYEMQALTLPFRRGKTAIGSGYGLGLDIVQRLCQRYGWRLSLCSSQGEGTRVKVHFS